MLEIVKQAIENRNLLEFTYKNQLRIVEPYTYGTNRNGNQLLSAYQIAKECESTDKLGWKIFVLDQINDLKILKNSLKAIRTEQKLDDLKMSCVFSTV